MERARDLQKTDYKEVTIGPDMTLKQRQERRKCVRKWIGRTGNSAKNLEWMMMGPRGEKRIIKGANRENQEGSGRGRGIQVTGARKKTGHQRKRSRNSDTEEEEDRMDSQES